jgi:hypothetical protein
MNRFLDALTFGPARRRRAMHRRLARLDKAYRTGEASRNPRDWTLPERSADASLVRLLLVLVLIAAAVLGVVIGLRAVTGPETAPQPADPPATSRTASHVDDMQLPTYPGTRQPSL